MRIWLTRHGQTELNKKKLMQGLTDEPLNEKGILQAKSISEALDVRFDAVYASPLKRAIKTAAIIAGIDEEDVLVDKRIIEVDFGRYEAKSYFKMGPAMTLYWALPEIFKAPKTVENIPAMIKRSESFLMEIEKKDYENVLIVCHGGIIRALAGYLENRKKKIKWRPKPKNCEVRVYHTDGEKRYLEKVLKAEKI